MGFLSFHIRGGICPWRSHAPGIACMCGMCVLVHGWYQPVQPGSGLLARLDTSAGISRFQALPARPRNLPRGQVADVADSRYLKPLSSDSGLKRNKTSKALLSRRPDPALGHLQLNLSTATDRQKPRDPCTKQADSEAPP